MIEVPVNILPFYCSLLLIITNIDREQLLHSFIVILPVEQHRQIYEN